MSRTLLLGILIALLVAAALRLPQLDARPMHNDEGINGIKLRTLWERGSFTYDPTEFHGPTLPYFTWAWMKLVGTKNFADFTETQLRMVTVIFGLGLILLLPLVADGLGKRATLCAAFFIAISPAMTFYSRYFIHEMLLVFFTFLALAAGWRYVQNPKIGWALLAGAAVGLMQATKETFVLAIAAMVLALFVNNFLGRRKIEQEKTERTEKVAESHIRVTCLKHFSAALLVWFVIVIVLFSSFFTNASGVLDSVRTYLPWLHRAGGASPHIHPWNFYLERLAWFHTGKGPIWSEALILALALIGLLAAFARPNRETGEALAESRQRLGVRQSAAAFDRTEDTTSRSSLPPFIENDSNPHFLRFIAFYTLILTAAYCAIGYKTPWCLLNFWHGMILLAGVGTVTLLSWLRKRPLQIAAGILLLAGAAQLSCQAWRADIDYAADRHNPYVYAQTSPDVLNLVARIDGLAKANKGPLLIKVMAPQDDYGPLPWYLRAFKDTSGWYGEVPRDPYAPVMIVSTQFHASLDEKKTHIMVGLNELRPGIWFETYVETNLWDAYLKTRASQP